ncbi:hypothetical protein TrST_g13712 [Triparma strigata]|uniref:PDZ domain-containing protein n=1 Tax=Triparma strigata TaxID=1606541 RepID=A0A9W7EWH3_9STRA|nr:hypothetical protein TrST_g13712 [Triparma strigata]
MQKLIPVQLHRYEDTTEALAKCTGNGTVTSKPEVGRRSLLVQSPRSRRFRRRLDEKVEIEIDMTVLVVETNPSVTVPPVVSATALTDAIDNDPLGFDAILDDIVTAAIAANLVPTTLNADNVAEIIVSEGGTSTNPPQAVQPSSGGMSGGAVAGIVVGGVAVLGLLGIAANEMRKKRNRDSGSTWGSEENDDELEQYEGKHNSRRSRANDYDLEVAKPEDIDFITSVDSNDDFKRSTSRSNSRGASSVGQVSVRGDLKALEMQISSGDNAIGRALGGGATQTMGFANSQSTSFGSASAGYDVETVYAPPGKLGVVVDSSHSGPCVHCVRDNSPLLNIIRVGDKILSIDDIDCRSMSAGAVTKLMAKKSGQKERKLVFAHQIDPQEGGG